MHPWSPEIVVDEGLCRRLIREQFPAVEAQSVRLLGEGWDNTVWLVDEAWTFRFPRRSIVISGLENEIAYLPRLAPLLPLPVPVPTLIGEPSEAFGWPFYGAPFLAGSELADAALPDDARLALAGPLAEFLRALHGIELDGELPADPVRRADMTYRAPLTRERLAEGETLGLWRVPRFVYALVATAETLGPARHTAITHGDLHARHLLVHEDGQAAAVIDWIDLSRNDRGVDLVLYWAALPPEGRSAFLEVYGSVTEEELVRARVLALFLCATLAIYAHREGLPTLELESVGGVHRTLKH